MRGRDGHVLLRRELARELPHFIHKELVEIGEHYPFYNDFNRTGMASQCKEVSEIVLHMSFIGAYGPKQGGLTVLHSIWSKAGIFTNHASAFQDCDWSKGHITSILHHFFVCGMEDICNSAIEAGFSSLEFQKKRALSRIVYSVLETINFVPSLQLQIRLVEGD